MKLAEALILRADVQKRMQQLRERLNRSVKTQEGEAPPEDPQVLLAELGHVVAEFTMLAQRINRTNAQTLISDGRTLTDALAERDGLAYERSILASAIDAAASGRHYGSGDIRILRTVNVAEIQQRVDRLARQYRELDTAIQAMNWQADLLD